MDNYSKKNNRDYINTRRTEEYKELGYKSIKVKEYIKKAKNEVKRDGR